MIDSYIIDSVDLSIIVEEFEKRKHQLEQMTPNHKFHNTNTAEHILRVVNHAEHVIAKRSDNVTEDESFTLIGTCYAHDLGKLETWNPEGSPWFRGHEDVSADILIRECGFPEDHDVVNTVRYHGRLQQFDKMGTKARLKLADKISNFLMFVLLQLCDAEGFSPEGKRLALNQLDLFVDFLYEENMADFRYLLDDESTDAFGNPTFGNP